MIDTTLPGNTFEDLSPPQVKARAFIDRENKRYGMTPGEPIPVTEALAQFHELERQHEEQNPSSDHVNVVATPLGPEPDGKERP
jgi:hypothetical protein